MDEIIFALIINFIFNGMVLYFVVSMYAKKPLLCSL